jgi:hypothetical protein
MSVCKLMARGTIALNKHSGSLLCILLTIVATTGSGASLRAEVLYARSGSVLFDGRFGPVAQAQGALSEQLSSCKGQQIVVAKDGKFGSGMVAAIKQVVSCPAGHDLTTDDQSRDGKLTDTLWKVLLPPTPPPDLDSRVQTLVLSYEATDYTQLEWNFCQTKPFFDPQKPGSVCFSNDPHSFMTWGPRGATAGGGREIQAIVWNAEGQVDCGGCVQE